MPLTAVSVENFSKSDREHILKDYNDSILDKNNKLPFIQFTIRHKHGRKKTNVSKGTKSHKIRPVFTEGLSSKSVKDEPVFYLRNQLILSSNQPGSVHYIRDNSKLILESAVANKKPQKTKTLAHATILDATDLGQQSEGVKITRNNTMLLPKIFMERELPLSESSMQLAVTRKKRIQSPRDILTRQYIQYQDNIRDNIPLSVISESRLLRRDSGDNVVPFNSPIKGVTQVFDEDNVYLERQKSFVMESSDDFTGAETGRSQFTYSRMSEVPVVSVGDEVNIEYYRRYKPCRSVAGTDTGDYDITRPSTMESRYTMSTPGRKYKPKHRQLPLSSQSMPFHTKEVTTHQKGVVIAEEENLVHAISNDNADNLVANSVKRITIGDPVKDSNKQDKKLNNSKLDDLYKRGVMQKQSSNRKSYIPRSPVKRAYDRLYSRASGNSIVIGNPPPSIATMASSPAFDYPTNGYNESPGPVKDLTTDISDKPKLLVTNSLSLQGGMHKDRTTGENMQN